jgi:hypothetical protein
VENKIRYKKTVLIDGLLSYKRRCKFMEYDNNEILGLHDLYKILPFGEQKIRKLISSQELPVVKIGRNYITTKRKLMEWIEQNIGEELYY